MIPHDQCRPYPTSPPPPGPAAARAGPLSVTLGRPLTPKSFWENLNVGYCPFATAQQENLEVVEVLAPQLESHTRDGGSSSESESRRPHGPSPRAGPAGPTGPGYSGLCAFYRRDPGRADVYAIRKSFQELFWKL